MFFKARQTTDTAGSITGGWTSGRRLRRLHTAWGTGARSWEKLPSWRTEGGEEVLESFLTHTCSMQWESSTFACIFRHKRTCTLSCGLSNPTGSHTPHPQQPASYCPFHPAGAGSPGRKVTSSGDTQRSAAVSDELHDSSSVKTTPALVGVYVQRQHKLWRQRTLCGSAENNERGSLSHMSLDAPQHPAQSHLKSVFTIVTQMWGV